MKKQLAIVATAGIIVLAVVGLKLYSDNTDSIIAQETIIGIWGDNNGDIWTFRSDGELNVSGKNFEFQYWFDEDGFLWRAIKGDDYLHAKYSITFEGHDKITLVHLGILMFDKWQDAAEPKTYVLTRIE